MLERDIERKLTAHVRSLGGWAMKLVSPGNAGVPDRLIILPGGQVIFAELKTDTGRVSPLQWAAINRLRELGARAVIVRGEQGLEQICTELYREAVDNEQMRTGQEQ